MDIVIAFFIAVISTTVCVFLWFRVDARVIKKINFGAKDFKAVATGGTPTLDSGGNPSFNKARGLEINTKSNKPIPNGRPSNEHIRSAVK